MKPLEHAVAELNLNGNANGHTNGIDNGHGQELDSNGATEKQEERLIIGIDFGTTYSG